MTDLTQTSPETGENIRTVEGFLNALQDEDFEAADAALDDDLVYENVGLPTIHGRRRAMKLFRRMEGRSGFEVKIHRIAADGAAVLTERSDALIFGPLRLQFWVCGVFEVHDGRITLWRDYFDMFDMVKATRVALRRSRCRRSKQASNSPAARQSAQFVERLRPTEQPIGSLDQLGAVALLRRRQTRQLPDRPFADDTNCAAAVTISLY